LDAGAAKRKVAENFNKISIKEQLGGLGVRALGRSCGETAKRKEKI